MSDPVTKAKEEIRIFERPSKKTAEEMIEEIERLRELLDFALEGLDSAPRSWGLDITHSNHIRRNMERKGMEPLAERGRDNE